MTPEYIDALWRAAELSGLLRWNGKKYIFAQPPTTAKLAAFASSCISHAENDKVNHKGALT